VSYDIALTGHLGHLLVHRADCTFVRLLADAGQPVATLLDCQNPAPPDMKRHSCMKE